MTPSQTVLQYFGFSHLPAPLKVVSGAVAGLALHMEATLPDGPEKTMGIRKLLEAKDCFVRAMLEGPDKPWWQTTDLTEMIGEPPHVDPVQRGGIDYGVQRDPWSMPSTEADVIVAGSVHTPTEDVLEKTIERKNAEAARDAYVIKNVCYGPVQVTPNDNPAKFAATCYHGYCRWTFEFADGAYSMSELQNRHNDAADNLA